MPFNSGFVFDPTSTSPVTDAKLDEIIANQEEQILILQDIDDNTDQIEPKLDLANTSLDNIEASTASIDTKLTTVNTNLTQIDTDLLAFKSANHVDLGQLHTDLLNVEAKQDLQTTQLTAINANTDTLEALVTSSNTKLDTLHTDLVVIEGKQDLQTTQLNAINANTDQIEPKLDTIHADLVVIEGKQDIGNASLSSIDTKLTTVNTNLTTIDTDLNSFKSANHTDLGVLHSDNVVIEGKLDSIITQATAINANTDTLEALVTSSNTKLDTLHTDFGVVEGKQDTGNASLSSIDTKLTTTNSQLTAINANTDTLEALIGTSNTQLTAINANTDGIETLITSSNTKLDSIITQTTAINANTDTLESLEGSIKTAVEKLPIAQGATTVGQFGELVMGSVTTSAPTYTTAQTSPLSLTTTGLLRVDTSGSTSGVNITQYGGVATSLGQKASASSMPVVLSTEQEAEIGIVTETAPATDTASSGLNGRLQRIAQRLSSLIALIPTSLGQKASAASFAVVLSTEQEAVLSLNNTLTGAVTETAPASDTASSGLNGRLQRIAQRLTTLIAFFASGFGSIAAAIRVAAQLGDGAGNAITSTLVGSKQRLDVTTPVGLQTGTLTAALASQSGAPGAGSVVQLTVPDGSSNWQITLNGTFSAGSQVAFEGSETGNNADWFYLNGRRNTDAVTNDTTTLLDAVPFGGAAPTGGNPSYWRGNSGGINFIRVRCITYTAADAIAVRITTSTGVGAVFLNAAIPTFADKTGVGTIAALAANVSGSTSGCANINFTVTGTWVATLLAEGTSDGGTSYQQLVLAPAFGIALVSTTINGTYSVNPSGYSQVRIRASLYTSGTATVNWEATAATRLVQPINLSPDNFLTRAYLSDSAGTAVTLGQKVMASSLPVVIASDQAPIPNAFIDAANSTSATLGIGGVFTGAWTAVSNYSNLSIMIFADQVSATDGLAIQYSTNGGTNTDDNDVFTVPASNGQQVSFGLDASHYRIVYTNGGVAQGAFRMQAKVHNARPKPSSQRLGTPLNFEQDAELTVSAPARLSLTPASPTTTSVGVATASAVASNTARKGLILQNRSTLATISLGFGASAVLNSGVTLTPGGIYNMNEFDFYTGQINAIASLAASNMSIQEFS